MCMFLVNEVLKKYGITEDFKCEEFGISNHQNTYKIFYKTQKIFLKKSQKKFANPVSLYNRYYVLEELKRRNINVPLLIKDIKGNRSNIHNNACIEIYQWLDIKPCFEKGFYSLVNNLCRLFEAYSEIPIPAAYYSDRAISIYRSMLINDIKNYKYEFYDDCFNKQEIIIHAMSYFEHASKNIEQILVELPLCYIHGDLNKTNIGYSNEDFYVFDFDTTRLGFILEDIAFIFYDIVITESVEDEVLYKTKYYIESVNKIFPFVNLDLILFFLVKRLLTILSSYRDIKKRGDSIFLDESYLKGLEKMIRIFEL